MPRKPDPRDSFQNLIARYSALHADFTAQTKARKDGAASVQAARLVRTLLGDTRRHLGPAHAAKSLPFLPRTDTPSAADLALILTEARAVLETHARTFGHDQPRTDDEARQDDRIRIMRQLAELTMRGVEQGVDARMKAIAAGEDPEQAYTIFHTEFYQEIYSGHPDLPETERQRPAPRLPRDEIGHLIDRWQGYTTRT